MIKMTCQVIFKEETLFLCMNKGMQNRVFQGKEREARGRAGRNGQYIPSTTRTRFQNVGDVGIAFRRFFAESRARMYRNTGDIEMLTAGNYFSKRSSCVLTS